MRATVWLMGLVLLWTAPGWGAELKVHTSSAEDQSAVEITVYDNLALVKDVRNIPLPPGEGELRFTDVAARLMPASVQVNSVNDPQHFTVFEQRYRYDLMDARELLDRYVGKKIRIATRNEFHDRKDVVEAVLLNSGDPPVYLIGEEVYLGHPGYQVLPKLPEDLVEKPTLSWTYQNSSAQPQRLEVSYLTENITWRADYVLAVDETMATGDLAAWATVENRSGVDFRNAGVRLVAGEVHRATPELRSFVSKALAPAGTSGEGFEERSLFEYHSYNLGKKTTVGNNQSIQLSLLDAKAVPVKRQYVVEGASHWFTNIYQDDGRKRPVAVHLTFKNDADGRLAKPLPAGVVRVYLRDRDGTLSFIGEDRVNHLPVGEQARVRVGTAFDVLFQRTQMDFREISPKIFESEWEITFINHKPETLNVAVIEPMLGVWKLGSTTHSFSTMDGNRIKFDVELPSEREVKLKFWVRVAL